MCLEPMSGQRVNEHEVTKRLKQYREANKGTQGERLDAGWVTGELLIKDAETVLD